MIKGEPFRAHTITSCSKKIAQSPQVPTSFDRVLRNALVGELSLASSYSRMCEMTSESVSLLNTTPFRVSIDLKVRAFSIMPL